MGCMAWLAAFAARLVLLAMAMLVGPLADLCSYVVMFVLLLFFWPLFLSFTLLNASARERKQRDGEQQQQQQQLAQQRQQQQHEQQQRQQQERQQEQQQQEQAAVATKQSEKGPQQSAGSGKRWLGKLRRKLKRMSDSHHKAA